MLGGQTLGIDVGSTATKVVLLNTDSSWEMHEWSSKDDLWSNLRTWLQSKDTQITRVGITAHGPSAIVIRDGDLCGRIIPWHEPLPKDCERPTQGAHQLPQTRAWVPSRLAQWETEFGAIDDGIAIQLKDMYNWELTGIVARDSRSMRGYLVKSHLHLPEEVIGLVNKAGAELSGIPEGVEVICGCDDLTAGVIGLGVQKGVVFNLANTSEHVGVVGEEPIDGLSWLPPLGSLPALTYNATLTGFGTSNTDRDVEVADLVRVFPPRELWIGGGLAMNKALVKRRNAIFKAGSEVSALGIAKLAQRTPHAVIFGGGKVGRGFLAQLLSRSGWTFTLVEAHQETVNTLQKHGGWHTFNLATQETEWIEPQGVFHTSQDLETILDHADLILTSIGASHLQFWAQEIRNSLCKRLEKGDLDLILAENHPRPAFAVRQALLQNASEEQEELIERRLGIAQAQVLRSCIEPLQAQHPLTVQIQDHWTLPLDGDAIKTDFSIQGFEKMPHFERELTRKLFTYNCVNAMVCYLGHLAGYEWLADAANDPRISAMALQAGQESSAALVAAYGFEPSEQKEWCERALAKYQDRTIRDPIERNARDPVRKLGRFERLIGPINLCKEHDLPHESLLVGVAAALQYPGAKIEHSLPLGEAHTKLQSLLTFESI
tara:strand:+ start:4739 stop:6718 length:1980 start_codon:yes stop_codon:yes gene_type:complete